MKTPALSTIAFLILALCLVGCSKPIPQKSLWTGTLALPAERQLPFQMELDLDSAAPMGSFINGPERTPIPEVYRRGDSLIFVFSEYGAAMRAVWKSGRLSGHFLRFRKDTTAIPFEARPIEEAPRTAESSRTVTVPTLGKYRVYSRTDDNTDSASIATFWVKGDTVFGTFIASDGDLGLLAGTYSDNELHLSRFTGWQANLLELHRAGDRWQGKHFTRASKPASITLEPLTLPQREILDAKKTTMKNPKKSFTFSGLSIAGDTMTQDNPRLKGKALIIDIMGTWCHNCMDAAPLLEQLHKEFGKQGLEVVGLSFELSNDFATARKNLLLFQKRYGITYTLLFCGTTESANVDARLRSQLNDFFSYPTTILVDPKGIVREIHVGFKGPGTGEEYQQQVRLYYDAVKKLTKGRLASKK